MYLLFEGFKYPREKTNGKLSVFFNLLEKKNAE